MKNHEPQSQNQHQTLTQTKHLLWNEIKEILETEDNIEVMKEYSHKNEVKEQDLTVLRIISNNTNDMLDDVISDKIVNSYMPTSYDDMIEWTRRRTIVNLYTSSYFKT